MRTSVTSFDGLIAQRSVLKHPFYVRWSAGELTIDHLCFYAKEYFRLVERIPGIVERVRDCVEDRELRDRIHRNVVEEQEHVGLWKRFARSLGLSERELLAHKVSAKTQEAIRTLEELAEMGSDEGMAAMYALEKELPAIAQAKKDGLTRFYGLTSSDAHIYFDEHLGEEKHLEVWRAKDVDAERSRIAATTSLTAQHAILDAVCEACGIPLLC